jgi:hypothetical protein
MLLRAIAWQSHQAINRLCLLDQYDEIASFLAMTNSISLWSVFSPHHQQVTFYRKEWYGENTISVRKK